MDEYRDSPLLRMLIAEGLRGKGVGAPKAARGRKGRGAAIEGARSPVNAAMEDMNTMGRTGAEGGQAGPIYLCWINPHMTKATGRRTSRAALVICE